MNLRTKRSTLRPYIIHHKSCITNIINHEKRTLAKDPANGHHYPDGHSNHLGYNFVHRHDKPVTETNLQMYFAFASFSLSLYLNKKITT